MAVKNCSDNIPEWVEQQKRTMTRWINSKLRYDAVKDISIDLKDGLVLVKLINQVILESPNEHGNEKRYLLTSVYEKPKFRIQMVENLNDFLKFCRLILNINILNVNGENIYEGNVKLILGLVWTIFIYSTSNAMPLYNNSSYSQIKTILMNWVNQIINRKDTKISNLNKDWSIEINRPDLYLSYILDYYLPGHFEILLKKFQNLTNVFAYTESIGIPRLVEADDFLSLVPDETCVVTFLVEWFYFFEGDQKHKEMLAEGKTEKFDALIELLTSAVDMKRSYELKGAMFLNQITSLTQQINENSIFFENFIAPLKNHLNQCMLLFDESFNSNSGDFEQFFDLFLFVQEQLNDVIARLDTCETYRVVIKPQLTYKDFPELKSLSNTIRNNLEEIGIQYLPSKELQLENLDEKFQSLISVDAVLISILKVGIKDLKEVSKFKELNGYLNSIEDHLKKHRHELDPGSKDNIIKCLGIFDYLIEVNHKLDYHSRRLNIERSTSELKKLLETSFIKHCTNYNVDADMFLRFKQHLCIYSDLTCSEMIKEMTDITSADISTELLLSFIQQIPNKSIIREDNDSHIQYSSDDSDESSIFDGVHKQLYLQLSGHDKLYNFGDFFERIDNRFCI
ncbi:uncharacterized protein PRCAT00000250001 [Priceomyces carsonii]|uniref:uncharacterized protein n=1 Tax=Priceomyces carsonii TaxID=28549 RepID=UPI002EDA87EA|nr:unnamed protein product [Priceomyces carsonii]